jgi:polyisoprenoid-binding protein YceI
MGGKMKNHQAFLLSVTLLWAVACKNPAEDKPKATVSPPDTTPTTRISEDPAPPAAALSKAPSRFTLDAANTSLIFVGSKVTGSHEGKFEKLKGQVETVGDDPSSAKISVSVETASLKTDAEKLDGHLKSPDFFDVEKFPTAVFESTAVAAQAGSPSAHTISGNLTLHGVTKQITFPATIAVSDKKVAVKSEFSINRRDFGIVYPGMPDDLIRDDVLMKINIDLSR